MAVHVPGGREKAAIGAARARGRRRALLHAAATAAYLHADVVVQLGLGQWHVTQQTGHHHRLVHVVHGADEAIHGVKERVLLVVGVANLHHGGRVGAEAQGRRGTGWPARARGCPPSRALRGPRREPGYCRCGGIPGSSSALSNSRLDRSPALRDARLLALASGSLRYQLVVPGSSPCLLGRRGRKRRLFTQLGYPVPSPARTAPPLPHPPPIPRVTASLGRRPGGSQQSGGPTS